MQACAPNENDSWHKKSHVCIEYSLSIASNRFSPQSTKVFFFKTNENTLRDKQTNKRSPTKDRKYNKHRKSLLAVEKFIFFTRKEPHKNSINIVEMFCGESNAISFLSLIFFFVLFVCAVHVAQSVGILSDVFLLVVFSSFWSVSKGKRYRRYIFSLFCYCYCISVWINVHVLPHP